MSNRTRRALESSAFQLGLYDSGDGGGTKRSSNIFFLINQQTMHLGTNQFNGNGKHKHMLTTAYYFIHVRSVSEAWVSKHREASLQLEMRSTRGSTWNLPSWVQWRANLQICTPYRAPMVKTSKHSALVAQATVPVLASNLDKRTSVSSGALQSSS